MSLDQDIERAIVIRNIVWVEDPDSDWTCTSRPRDLPDECECPARDNDLLAEAYGKPTHEPYTCDCPDEKLEHHPPARRALWQVVLLHKNNDKGMIAEGLGQSPEEAYDVAVLNAQAKHAARFLAADKDTSADA